MRGCGLEASLIHLVKLRASQINGCAYWIHVHIREAHKDGEREERLYLLDAWEESSLYIGHERAALLWTDAVSRVAESRVADSVSEQVSRPFGPAELVELAVLIVTIDAWNRIAISFRSQHPTCPLRPRSRLSPARCTPL